MKLTAAARRAIPSSEFALPGERKYPIENASHARNAIARAAQQEKAGHISKSTEQHIVAKANRKLHGDGVGHDSGH
jgi:hypothetical protein